MTKCSPKIYSSWDLMEVVNEFCRTHDVEVTWSDDPVTMSISFQMHKMGYPPLVRHRAIDYEARYAWRGLEDGTLRTDVENFLQEMYDYILRK